jgi:hypothetical protein
VTIVRTDYRPKRARKRKQPVDIPRAIVSAQPPKPKRAKPAPVASRIVSAPRKTSTRFGPVQEIDHAEHQRRGDAAEALFRELSRRARE